MGQTPTSPEPDTPDTRGAGDEALIGLIGSVQDRTAFTELFHRYAGRIKAFLIRSGASWGEAEEAAQEVMVTIWRKAAMFDPAKAGASTWIYTIARNKRIDLLRRARRPEGLADEPILQGDPVESPEADVAAIGRDALIREAIQALPADQKLVINLAFFSGLTHAEIATALDVPLGTVKSRLRLSFGKLREELGQDFALELVDI
ncbi:MAG: sigma-70 family RNA polymerase sigma factor [Pseudomonadota bacterium]